MPTVFQRIQQYNSDRRQDVLSAKYKAMAKSPFRFLRGSCHLFYEDIGSSNFNSLPASPLNWISGDLHLENFGSYKDRDKEVCFNINDFEEAALAPVTYELSRLLVSVHLAAMELNVSSKDIETGCLHLLRHYNKTILSAAAVRVDQNNSKGVIRDLIDEVLKQNEKELILNETNKATKGARLLFDEKKLREVPAEEKNKLAAFFEEWFNSRYYEEYEVSDLGFRLAGTGSIGVPRYCLLLENIKEPTLKKLIDIKASIPSSIEQFTNLKQPAWKTEAERIIFMQQRMQFGSPAYLASLHYEQNWFVVRELQRTVDKIDIEKVIDKPNKVLAYIEDLGEIVASAQLRCANFRGSATTDDLKVFAADGSWISELIDWSRTYAEKVMSDYAEFLLSLKQKKQLSNN